MFSVIITELQEAPHKQLIPFDIEDIVYRKERL